MLRALILPALLALPAPTAPSAGDTATLSVRGTAEVAAPAGRAHLRFAVETRAAEAGDAVRENATRMETVIDALREAGIPEDGVQTSGFSVHPEHRRPGPEDPADEPRIVSYRVVNGVDVTTDDVDAVGRLIDVAVEAGANRISDLGFGPADADSLREEALRRAVESAREEAETVAAAVGRSLGPVLEVEIEDAGIRSRSVRTQQFAMMEARADTPIEPGEVTVRATVALRYRLEARR